MWYQSPYAGYEGGGGYSNYGSDYFDNYYENYRGMVTGKANRGQDFRHPKYNKPKRDRKRHKHEEDKEYETGNKDVPIDSYIPHGVGEKAEKMPTDDMAYYSQPYRPYSISKPHSSTAYKV